MKISDVIAVVERHFPPRYQEDFDNTGLQVGIKSENCSGVLLCVDVTEEIVDEAIARECNLILSHHPLIFHGLKMISDRNRIDRCIYKAIRGGVAIYSCHTAVDNTPTAGVSWRMAEMLGLENVEALEARGADNIGSGAIGNLPAPLTALELIEKVKATFGSPVARCSRIHGEDKLIDRVGLCGGAGSFLIPDALRRGAKAFVTSDCKFNLFLDYEYDLQLIDIGHFESEQCTKLIFMETLTKEIPSLKILNSETETNPITYI